MKYRVFFDFVQLQSVILSGHGEYKVKDVDVEIQGSKWKQILRIFDIAFCGV